LGIIYIGDRATGKTSLALELTNPKYNYVRITNCQYQDLKDKLFRDGEIQPTAALNSLYENSLQVEVQLPAGAKNLSVNWVDTPGEVWRKSWRKDNPDNWQKLLNNIQESEGIILVLPPYREMPSLNSSVDSSLFPTKEQWCQRFQRWVNFFQFECPKAQQITICLNKADLFCNIEKEESELGYHPRHNRKGWFERHSYVKQRYFKVVQTQLDQISSATEGAPVRCFITTIHNRSLLELPWLYLASQL